MAENVLKCHKVSGIFRTYHKYQKLLIEQISLSAENGSADFDWKRFSSHFTNSQQRQNYMKSYQPGEMFVYDTIKVLNWLFFKTYNHRVIPFDQLKVLIQQDI